MRLLSNERTRACSSIGRVPFSQQTCSTPGGMNVQEVPGSKPGRSSLVRFSRVSIFFLHRSLDFASSFECILEYTWITLNYIKSVTNPNTFFSFLGEFYTSGVQKNQVFRTCRLLHNIVLFHSLNKYALSVDDILTLLMRINIHKKHCAHPLRQYCTRPKYNKNNM